MFIFTSSDLWLCLILLLCNVHVTQLAMHNQEQQEYILLFSQQETIKNTRKKILSKKFVVSEMRFYLLTLCEASACSAPRAPPRPPALCLRGWTGTALGNWTLNPSAESPGKMQNTNLCNHASWIKICCQLITCPWDSARSPSRSWICRINDAGTLSSYSSAGVYRFNILMICKQIKFVS